MIIKKIYSCKLVNGPDLDDMLNEHSDSGWQLHSLFMLPENQGRERYRVILVQDVDATKQPLA